jgi:HTH-type transcriptional regulator/antitoxin HigA
METLKYKVITTEKQYMDYCNKLESLVFGHAHNKATEDEIDLLTLLIEKYDDDHIFWTKLDPVEMLKSFMDDHNLKAKDLAEMLGISKGLVSNILSYKKGLSKESIRILADRFKVNQEAFNRPYILKGLLEPNEKKTTLITRKYKMAG